jgi:hypothetical protein
MSPNFQISNIQHLGPNRNLGMKIVKITFSSRARVITFLFNFVSSVFMSLKILKNAHKYRAQKTEMLETKLSSFLASQP